MTLAGDREILGDNLGARSSAAMQGWSACGGAYTHVRMRWRGPEVSARGLPWRFLMLGIVHYGNEEWYSPLPAL